MDRVGSGADGSTNLVQRLILHALFGLFVATQAVLAAYPVHAGGGTLLPPNQPTPQNIRWVNATPGGVDTSVNGSIPKPTGGSSHFKLRVPVSAATLGALANGFMKRGVPMIGAALTLKQLIEGAGWAIDELTGQVQDPGTPLEPLGEGAWCLQTQGGIMRCASSPGQLTQSAHLASSPGTREQPCVVASYHETGGANYQCRRPSDGAMLGSGRDNFYPKPASGWDGWLNENPFSPPTDIPDADVGNLVKNNPQVVNAILIDPETGAPIRTPELVAALNAYRRAFEAANGIDPGPDLDPQTDYSEHTPSQTDWPEFCGWASIVCDFMDWFRDDTSPDLGEKPEVPVEEMDPSEIEQSWSSGLGNGSCPAPYSTPVLDGYFEIQWQPVCDIVDYLRPFLIAIALAVAACIVAGVRVGKNA